MNDLTTYDKSKVKILQNFMAFSECMRFNVFNIKPEINESPNLNPKYTSKYFYTCHQRVSKLWDKKWDVIFDDIW